ncbi:uncharacterized protein SCHCODRAFT_02560532 [Schizophyllum commune H4-8]|nr:uncharacterized protein SCHCODRAFT_02560532 [Schizophyllum commune H4-8]KAI5899411.1 hypothetical protein SCHCODRAFT_02560532 [Schizophyllum commune H4-8]
MDKSATISLCASCDAAFAYHPELGSSQFTLDALRTGGVPDTEESIDIQDAIQRAERELKRFDPEIDRLLAIVFRLRAQKGAVEELLAHRRACFSPYRRLPVELLRQIMVDACADSALEYSAPAGVSHPISYYTALSISQVTQRWRNIAHATAEIWAPLLRVKLTNTMDREIGKIESDRVAMVLQHYFHFSRCTPFDIHLATTHSTWIPRQFGGNSFALDDIISTASRWRTCKLPYIQLAEIDQQIARYTLHELVKVEIVPSIMAVARDPDLKIVSFASTTKLRYWDGPIANTQLRWEQLTTLISTSRLSLAAWVPILQRCQQIEVLKMRVGDRHGGDALPAIQRVHLPRLAHFALHLADDPRALAYLFACFDTPLLRVLQLSAPRASGSDLLRHFREEGWPHEQFDAFIDRSGCTIRHLALQMLPISCTDVAALFQRLPGLTNLQIMHTERRDHLRGPTDVADPAEFFVNDDFLRQLMAVDGGEPAILPQLKHLMLACLFRCNLTLLADMIRSRVDVPIETLRLHLAESSIAPNKEFIAGLFAQVGKGMLFSQHQRYAVREQMKWLRGEDADDFATLGQFPDFWSS